MGEVYEAVRVGTGGFRKPVALKTLHVSLPAAGNPLERFLNECRISAQLEHPNIVRVTISSPSGDATSSSWSCCTGADASVLARAAGAPVPAWLPLSVACRPSRGSRTPTS